jgi:hypothetical protein
MPNGCVLASHAPTFSRGVTYTFEKRRIVADVFHTTVLIPECCLAPGQNVSHPIVLLDIQRGDTVR